MNEEFMLHGENTIMIELSCLTPLFSSSKYYLKCSQLFFLVFLLNRNISPRPLVLKTSLGSVECMQIQAIP